SSSIGEMANDLSCPSTSANHRRIMRTPRTATVRSTYSRWRSVLSMHRILGRDGAPRKQGLRRSHCVHTGATAAKRPPAIVSADLHRRERRTDHAMPYKAEYIWIDGTQPTARLRSKTKIIP